MAEKVRDTSADQVAITVNISSRVTAGYRAALFSAANRAGVSVSEYFLRAAGEKLARAGSRFPGVFDRETPEGVARPDPFADGGDHLVKVDLGTGFIPEREAKAFDRARDAQSMFQYATAAMRWNVEERAAR